MTTMKTSHTFSILFWINSSRSTNNKADLFLRITVNGRRANIGLKRKVLIDQWDKKAKKVKGTNAQAKAINNLINESQAKIYSIYQELKYKEELITAQLIKAKFFGEDEGAKSLQEILTYHNEKIEKTLSAGTIRNFGVTQKYIDRFLKKKLKTNDIYLKQLNFKFISDFETFLTSYYP